MKRLIILLLLALLLASCAHRVELNKRYPILGVAAGSAIFQDKNYTHIVKVYDAFTPENALKWDATEPQPGVFTWQAGDYLVDAALKAGRQVHGHALLWQVQLPAYVWNIKTCAEMKPAISEHIQAVMTHYQGRITTWDVVNEAYKPDGTIVGLKYNPFAICPDYVEYAFTVARQTIREWKVKPLLVYNDTFPSTPAPDGQANKAISLVKRGYADAIGIQMHKDVSDLGLPWLRSFLGKLRAAGIRANFSELDVSIKDSSQYQMQANAYRDILSIAGEYGDVLYRVTLWGADDGSSWLSSRLPLPWDKDLKDKPAAAWLYSYKNGEALPPSQYNIYIPVTYLIPTMPVVWNEAYPEPVKVEERSPYP